MANALGELFADMSYEIKVKRGEDPQTVKYKPTEFPKKIRDISVGIDTSDATATEDDLAQGATAYVNGKKISGALNVLSTVIVDAEQVEGTSDSVNMSVTQPMRMIVEGGAVVTMSAPLSDFGDATAEDVAVGKTFTSADGMLVVGTAESSGGGGGSSGGGGTLPAGIYLSASDITNPTIYRHKRFMLNGELYASCYPGTGSGFLRTLYKWNGTAWETLLTTSSTSTDIAGGAMDAVAWKCAEYNGKLHMLDGKTHHVFDGTNLTKTTALPNGESTSICVCNGKLYASSNAYKAGALYEWDDGNSTWNTVTTFTTVSFAGLVYSCGGHLYFIDGKTVYKYADGTLTSWGTAPVSANAYFHVDDTRYCYENSSYYTKWYRVNLETMEYTELGKHPSLYQVYPTLNADELSFTGCTYGTNSRFPFFVVNIVEATE